MSVIGCDLIGCGAELSCLETSVRAAREGYDPRGRGVAKPERDIRRAALLASPFFQAMQPPEIEEILALASERHVPRGTLLFQKGDNGSSMMAVLSGRVRISVVSAEGKEITLNVISPGEILGEIALLDGKPRSADATAIEPSSFLVIERRHFLPFLQRHADIYPRLVAVLCDRLRRTSLRLEELALFDLSARLARVLLKLADDFGRPDPNGIRIELKLSQRELSNLVGSSREGVNKQLRAWREDCVVDMSNGYLLLRKPQQLRTLMD
jgi:CRP/FNR family transcriptional regulator, cyclic AMP receptor protein